MLLKILFINLFLLSFSYATFQEVRIGNIDAHYKNKINKQELRNILNEIEHVFESELAMNIFDYSENGKPIDILYVPASRLEQRMERKKVKLKLKIEKIEDTQGALPSELEEIQSMKIDLKYDNNILNEKIKDLNRYVKKVNKQKNFSQNELAEIKKTIKTEKKKIKVTSDKFKKEQRKLKSVLKAYNRKIRLQNNLIRDIKRLESELERLGRNFKKVKGKAFGTKEVTLKVFYENGKRKREKSVKHTMNKIEIYGFESKRELKAILAHELAHLAGIPHINAIGSLMNPILQKNQIKQLSLSKEDIINFKKNF